MNQNSEVFFQIIKKRIEDEILKQNKPVSIHERIYNCFKKVKMSYKTIPDLDDIANTLRFLQLLCENHNTDNQNWLRH